MKLINDESILPLIESQPQKKDDHSKQKVSKIQGLRGISILAVLLFHIRQDLFPVGYLGVDVFFVISGYLMCMLLSRHKQLNVSNVIDFYYKRIKRIVPVYLFVILSVLSSATLIWCYPTDYESLYAETIKPLFFASNIPDNTDYFAQSVDGYKFFKHLWSLSVEIQFYCFVPLLVFMLNYFSSLKRVFIVTIIGCLSFWFQFNSTGNEEHMSLNGRIWQFMCGFLAHYLSEYFNKSKGPSNTKNCGIRIGGYLLDIIFTIGILTLISIQVFESKAITRLVLLLFVVITIARPESNLILSNTLLVHLGDVSYSVYMVHWPVFEWHRYWNVSAYMYLQKIGFSTVFILITSSIIFGYVVEKMYIKLSVRIQGWKSLVVVIIILYLLIFSSLYYMKTNAIDQNKSALKLSTSKADKDSIDQEMIKIWNNEDDINSWNIEKSLKYNQHFKDLAWGLMTCTNFNQSTVPTAYDIKNMSISYTCYMKGNGTKNIVLIGNSFAQSMFYGSEQQFRGVYKSFTMIAAHECMLAQLVDNHSSKWKAHVCKIFRENVLKMLEDWKHPIDIIILGYAYPAVIPPVTANKISDDKLYQLSQELVSGLSKIAREVVFLPLRHLNNYVRPYLVILQRRIRYQQDLSIFKMPLTYAQELVSRWNKRILAIECSNCILVDWEKVLCNEKSGYCEMIDFKRKLAYFSDDQHHNAFGSIKFGAFMRNLYDDWALNNTLVNPKLPTTSTISSLSTILYPSNVTIH